MGGAPVAEVPQHAPEPSQTSTRLGVMPERTTSIHLGGRNFQQPPGSSINLSWLDHWSHDFWGVISVENHWNHDLGYQFVSKLVKPWLWDTNSAFWGYSLSILYVLDDAPAQPAQQNRHPGAGATRWQVGQHWSTAGENEDLELLDLPNIQVRNGRNAHWWYTSDPGTWDETRFVNKLNWMLI